jgi:hypothetical protein
MDFSSVVRSDTVFVPCLRKGRCADGASGDAQFGGVVEKKCVYDLLDEAARRKQPN